MTRRQNGTSDSSQTEFPFDVQASTTVAEPKPNRKQRRAAQPVPVPAPVAEAPKPKEPAVRPAAPAPKVTIKPADLRKPTSFEALLHAELSRLFNFCLRLTQDSVRAEDLTQEVFVRATKAAEEDPNLQWLYRSAISIFRRDRSYSRPRRAVIPAPADGATRPSLQPVFELPDVWKDLPEDHRLLLSAAGTLEADDRVALVLKDIEGRSYVDVAEVLETGESSARTRVSRARERLHIAARRIAEQRKP